MNHMFIDQGRGPVACGGSIPRMARTNRTKTRRTSPTAKSVHVRLLLASMAFLLSLSIPHIISQFLEVV